MWLMSLFETEKASFCYESAKPLFAEPADTCETTNKVEGVCDLPEKNKEKSNVQTAPVSVRRTLAARQKKLTIQLNLLHM